MVAHEALSNRARHTQGATMAGVAHVFSTWSLNVPVRRFGRAHDDLAVVKSLFLLSTKHGAVSADRRYIPMILLALLVESITMTCT